MPKNIYLGKDNRAAKSSVSRTVSDPIKASSCSTKELMLCKSVSEMVEPLTHTLLATSNLVPGFLRASTFRRVVLPLPEGPIRAVSVPNSTQRECSVGFLGQRTSLGISVYVGENGNGSRAGLPAAFFDLYTAP